MSGPESFFESAEELYESAPCGYLTASEDGALLRVNRTFLEWTGHSKASLLAGQRLIDLFTVGGQVFFETHLWPLLKMQGFVQEVQLEVRCADGRPLPVLLNLSRQQLPGGPLLVKSTIFNVTERQRYEQELRTARWVAERRARQALLGAEVSRVLTRAGAPRDLLARCASALVEHLEGAEVRIWVGGTLASLELWATAGVLSHAFEDPPQAPAEREKQVAVERRPVVLGGAGPLAADLSEVWLKREGIRAYAGVPVIGSDRLYGVVAFYAREPVSAEVEQALGTTAGELALALERWQAERERDRLLEEVTRQSRALAESRELLETTLRSIGDGVVSTDLHARITFMNPAAEALTGVGLKEVLGQHIDSVMRLQHASSGDQVANPIHRTLRDRQVVGLENHTVLIRNDGSKLPIDDSAAPISDRTGNVLGAVLVFRDVTPRYEAEQALRKMMEFEQQMVGVVSHDLRNPISAIALGASVLLHPGQGLTEKQLRSVARIQKSADRAGRLVRDLLDFTQARLGSGIPVYFRPIDLAEVVRQAIDEVQSPRVRLESRGDLNGEWDGDRLAQVVANLLSNALRYSPEGSPVKLALLGANDEVELSVSNLGAPIPPALHAQIFLPMKRGTQKAGRAPGSIGLGLFIVQQLVKAHGGTVHLSSDDRHGTTFRVRLPRRPAKAAGGSASG